MKPAAILIWMLLLCLLLPVGLRAQTSATSHTQAIVPRFIKFTGTLFDEANHPMKGPVGVTFSLYAQQSGGAALWMETQNIKPDASGNYTVLLGSASANGIPEELFASGQARWLAIEPEGKAEQPRVLLVSVPYALKASDAQTLGGLPASAFVLSNSNPTANATAVVPLAASTTSSATTAPVASACSPLTSSGTATAGKVAKFKSACDIEAGQITDTGTAIGIGNASPAAKLDVSGGGIFHGTLQLPSTGTANSTTKGFNSQPFDFLASVFNGTAAVDEHFRWQAEPVNPGLTTASGKLNLLFASGAATPAETGLSISHKGIVSFVSGQTFPGTVTSVGLSAPSSDFKVKGSPVTNSGTLALAWNVAPTSSDKPDAIVKRDSTGSFHAGQVFGDLGVEGITALTCAGCAGVSGVNTGGGLGVQGLTAGDAPAVLGQNSSTSGGIADGVHGVTSSAGASGVAGVNNSGGIGVFGVGGTGVFGTGSAFGFQTDSNAQQARTAGGWVKAMVFFDGFSGNVVSCFNSTLSGATATTPPCGFTPSKGGTGAYVIDFGFQVDDRFFSITGTLTSASSPSWRICTDSIDVGCGGMGPNTVFVEIFDAGSGTHIDNKFYLVVY